MDKLKNKLVRFEQVQSNDKETILKCFLLMQNSFPTMPPMTIGDFIKWILEKNVRCYSLNLSDEIIATATVLNIDDGDEPNSFLQNFCVASQYRKMGFGKMFLYMIADKENFIHWFTDKETALFYIKSGASVYCEEENRIWFNLYGKSFKPQSECEI